MAEETTGIAIKNLQLAQVIAVAEQPAMFIARESRKRTLRKPRNPR
jgi:hypothetical protein